LGDNGVDILGERFGPDETLLLARKRNKDKRRVEAMPDEKTG
jgi:hypothetical protein